MYQNKNVGKVEQYDTTARKYSLNSKIVKKMPSAKYKIERRCEICGNVFMAPTIDSKYCSKKCGNIAYRRKKAEERKNEALKSIVEDIDVARDYISVKEAIAMFNICKTSIYQYIRSGRINSINLGKNLIRVKRSEVAECFPKRPFSEDSIKRLPKLYNLEPENCYTIGDISKKYIIDESTVYLHIRKYSIPTRQIGNYVYVPKADIDELYKDVVR